MGGGSRGSGVGAGHWPALSSGLASDGGPINDRSTGRRTKPFSIPNRVRIAKTAKKYLRDGEQRGVSLFRCIKKIHLFNRFYMHTNKAMHACAWFQICIVGTHGREVANGEKPGKAQHLRS